MTCFIFKQVKNHLFRADLICSVCHKISHLHVDYVGDKIHFLGYYSNQEEAAKIYAKAACKYGRRQQDGWQGGLDLRNVPNLLYI